MEDQSFNIGAFGTGMSGISGVSALDRLNLEELKHDLNIDCSDLRTILNGILAENEVLKKDTMAQRAKKQALDNELSSVTAKVKKIKAQLAQGKRD